MSELTEPPEGIVQAEEEKDPSSDEIVELGHVAAPAATKKKKGKPQGKKVSNPKTNMIMSTLKNNRNLFQYKI